MWQGGAWRCQPPCSAPGPTGARQSLCTGETLSPPRPCGHLAAADTQTAPDPLLGTQFSVEGAQTTLKTGNGHGSPGALTIVTAAGLRELANCPTMAPGSMAKQMADPDTLGGDWSQAGDQGGTAGHREGLPGPFPRGALICADGLACASHLLSPAWRGCGLPPGELVGRGTGS